MKIKQNKSGLILTEALLAIAMLSIGSLVLASIIQNAVRTTALSKNYLIAQNLATEGMETIKSVRDTNWLLQADEPECWLEKEPDIGGDICLDVMMEGGSYLPQENGGKWKMVDGTGVLNLEDGDDPEYQMHVEDGRYSYNVIGEPTIFYRGINVVSMVGTDYAVFEVVVEWKEGQKVRSLKRDLLLYNFNQ
ncbi:MAG: hypothetical protein ABID64_02845 [Nitrospirota bacterium]